MLHTNLDTAVKYAGESGTVVAIPRTEGMLDGRIGLVVM